MRGSPGRTNSLSASSPAPWSDKVSCVKVALPACSRARSLGGEGATRLSGVSGTTPSIACLNRSPSRCGGWSGSGFIFEFKIDRVTHLVFSGRVVHPSPISYSGKTISPARPNICPRPRRPYNRLLHWYTLGGKFDPARHPPQIRREYWLPWHFRLAHCV